MEKRKLTKQDIDSVRHIEGFPKGSDEDIIALSDAPYYTACPNPFVAEFIAEHGTPYKVGSFTKRLSRIITQINEETNMDLSAKSIRYSGFYYRIYRNWEEAKLPYIYTEHTVSYLLSLLDLPPKTSTSVKQAEFARFLEYVREVQGKPV